MAQVDEISMYGTLVDEIDTGIGAQLLVTGNGADVLAHDVLICRRRPRRQAGEV